MSKDRDLIFDMTEDPEVLTYPAADNEPLQLGGVGDDAASAADRQVTTPGAVPVAPQQPAPLDGPQRKGNKRRSRACAVNIVPNTTGAAKAIGLVLPELNGKLIGAAQRVPTPTGSITNLYAVVDKKVTVDEVNAAMKAYAATISETFGYNEDDIVSTDIIGETHGSIFDATQTMCSDLGNGQTLVQVTSWYDNENSYTSQMVRTIKYFEKFVA